MYEIINNGIIIGYCDAPRYVREKNGIYISASSDDATHIVMGDTNYPIEETEIAEKNNAEILTVSKSNQMTTEREITDLEIENIEQEQALTDAEIAIIELQERIGE